MPAELWPPWHGLSCGVIVWSRLADCLVDAQGFIVGLLGTGVLAFYASRLVAHSSWLTCPRRDLSLGPLHCEPNRIFQDHAFTMQVRACVCCTCVCLLVCVRAQLCVLLVRMCEAEHVVAGPEGCGRLSTQCHAVPRIHAAAIPA